MSGDYQARRILHGFVIEDGEIKCMCATSDDAEGLVSLMVGDTAMFEVGVFKEVVNLLKENDKEKMAGSHYDCPSLFYEVAVEVHLDAKIREYLGFTMKERATRMKVVAEDLWNDPTMRVLAVELELWYFCPATRQVSCWCGERIWLQVW